MNSKLLEFGFIKWYLIGLVSSYGLFQLVIGNILANSYRFSFHQLHVISRLFQAVL